MCRLVPVLPKAMMRGVMLPSPGVLGRDAVRRAAAASRGVAGDMTHRLVASSVLAGEFSRAAPTTTAYKRLVQRGAPSLPVR